MRYKKINRKIFQKKKFNFEKNRTLKKDLLSVYSTLCRILYRIDNNDEVLDLVWHEPESDILYLNSTRYWMNYDLKTKFLNIGIFKIKIDSQVINKIVNYTDYRINALACRRF